MRKFLKIRGLLNSLQTNPPMAMGRKVSLPEEAIAAFCLRRLSDTPEHLSHFGYDRRRSQSVFGEGISRYSLESSSLQSNMEELTEI